MVEAYRELGPDRAMSDSLFADRLRARRAFVAALLSLAVIAAPALAAPPAPKRAEPVRIEGFDDEAMEPFLSRDGKFLFFNSRNDELNANIQFAEATDTGFVYRGVLPGTISYDLDAVPTMARDGSFCFVSPRDYRRTRVSVLCGTFDGKKVNNTQPQPTLATERMGRLIFDVELSADGRTMIFAEGTYSGGPVPDEADLYIATLEQGGYRRVKDGRKLFANINTSDLEYAPALSEDGLELFFTRPSGIWPFSQPKIFRARRATPDEPFGKPEELKIDGFVEGPSVADDGTLYFHKKVDGRYQIWRQPR
jgi:hypothetical protein